MMQLLTSLRGALSIVLVFSVLVAFHELGHYVVARWCGMLVEEFAIGFGPKLWVWRRKKFFVQDPATGEMIEEETEFTVRAIPLGGFVRMRGQLPTEDGSEFEIPGGFYNKTPLQRFWVLLAGPVFSLLLGVVFLCGVWLTSGRPATDKSPIIGTLIRGAGYAAGLAPGDKIISIDGDPIRKFHDMRRHVLASNGKSLDFAIERNGELKHFLVAPQFDKKPTPVLDANDEPTGKLERQYKIGAAPRITRTPMPAGEAISTAVMYPYRSLVGLVERLATPSTLKDDVSGPIGIAEQTASASKDPFDLIELAGLLSISLGVFNLICVPPLDGGQMLITVVEMIRRRRTSLQARVAVTLAGVMAMLALTVSVVVMDVKRIQDRPRVEQLR